MLRCCGFVPIAKLFTRLFTAVSISISPVNPACDYQYLVLYFNCSGVVLENREYNVENCRFFRAWVSSCHSSMVWSENSLNSMGSFSKATMPLTQDWIICLEATEQHVKMTVITLTCKFKEFFLEFGSNQVGLIFHWVKVTLSFSSNGEK